MSNDLDTPFDDVEQVVAESLGCPVEFTEKNPVIVDFKQKHDMEWAMATLPCGFGATSRSWFIGIIGAIVVAALYVCFCLGAEYLEKRAILPDVSVIVPELSNTYVVFLLAGVIALLFGSAAFYYQTSITAMKWLTQYVESCMETITAVMPADENFEKGCDLLKHRVHCMLLFAAQVPFRQRADILGHVDAMGVGNTYWAEWASANKVTDVIKASSGGVRMYFARGCIGAVRRFGPRPGLIVSNYLFFAVFLVLMAITMRAEMYEEYAIHRTLLMATLGYLTTTLLACAKNTSNPLRALGGSGSTGLAERHLRICVGMIDDAARQHRAAHQRKQEPTASVVDENSAEE